jgi:hypothetical protein
MFQLFWNLRAVQSSRFNVPGCRSNSLKNRESFKPIVSVGTYPCRRDRYQTGLRVSSLSRYPCALMA